MRVPFRVVVFCIISCAFRALASFIRRLFLLNYSFSPPVSLSLSKTIHQGDIGSISCELCPPGRVQPNTGSALGPASEGCAACPDGSFSDVNGSTTCGTCKKATYSNDARTGCVDECADGFVAVRCFSLSSQSAPCLLFPTLTNSLFALRCDFPCLF